MGIVKYTSNGSLWNNLFTGPVGPTGPAGGVSASRNWIVNGDMSVNQRGWSSENPGTVQAYSLDHWRIVCNGGGTVVFSVVTAALGELPESAPQYMRINTSGQGGVGDRSALFHQIEDIRSLAGKLATVSFWARGAASPYIGVELRQSIASGGAGTTTQSKRVSITPNWARHHVTIPVPSISGVTIGGAIDESLQLLLWTSANTDYAVRSAYTPTQNGIVDIWGVQVEEGAMLSPFEHKSYAENLRDCQRYFQRWKPPCLRGVAGGSTGVARMAMVLPIPMRRTPDATLYGTLPVYDGGYSGTITALGTTYCTPYIIEWDVTTNAFTAVGRPVVAHQDPASGYIDLWAEI